MSNGRVEQRIAVRSRTTNVVGRQVRICARLVFYDDGLAENLTERVRDLSTDRIGAPTWGETNNNLDGFIRVGARLRD